MDGIDTNIMRDATDLVALYGPGFHEVHTVTIVMNDASPEVTIQGYTYGDLSEHKTITIWKNDVTVVTE